LRPKHLENELAAAQENAPPKKNAEAILLAPADRTNEFSNDTTA
jgi:hypothetical protein